MNLILLHTHQTATREAGAVDKSFVPGKIKYCKF